MPRFEDLPYRPCVGVMVLNSAGLVFIGRRSEGPEHIDETHVWQMPQGGIDRGEDPWPAALRELYEETSIRSVARLGEINDWLSYDIPRNIVGQAWGGRYRGQTQKWYALHFTGDDSEINISSPGGGVHDPEFEIRKLLTPGTASCWGARTKVGPARLWQSNSVEIGNSRFRCARLEGWMHGMNSLPSFETAGPKRGGLLRMRSKLFLARLSGRAQT